MIEPSALRVEKLVAGGSALAREESGRVVLVPGALPGETVSVRIVGTRSGVARAELLDVLDASPQRVAPPCPRVTEGCGGCDWQHLDTSGQSEARTAIVVESLRRVGGIPDPPVRRGPSPGPAGLRTTVRLAVDDEGGLGFRALRSHRVVRSGSCLVAHPLVDDLIGRIAAPGAREITIRVGAATGERGVWWTPPTAPALRGLPPDVRTGADAVVHEVVSGRRLRVSPGAFFQPSLGAAELLVAAVARAAAEDLDALPEGSVVVDAYSGVGLFAAAVVPETHRVVCVEGSRAATADAAENLSGRDAEVVRCNVERWRPVPASLVIADPARSGLGRDAAARLVATGAPTLILVSCDPVSLARDAGLLRSAGYVLTSCETLDLFPHTHHVETVSVFRSSGTVVGSVEGM